MRGTARSMVTLETPRRHTLLRVARRPLGAACIVYLALVALTAFGAPIVFPEVTAEHAGDLSAIRQGPGPAHWLGTDTLGRDVLQRLLVGTRVTLLGVIEAAIVALAVGVPVGLAAGYFRGWVDRLVGWVTDLVFSVPAMIMVLVVLAVFPQSMFAAMVTLGLLTSPGVVRVVRSATLPVRDETYVSAAKLTGISDTRVITRHVLPRIAGPIIIQASLLGATALIVQTGLTFLGLIAPAPTPSWGGMVADGLRAIQLQPWLMVPPGVAISVTILTFGMLADLVRDATTERWAGERAIARPKVARGTRAPSRPPTALDGPVGALLAVRGLSVASTRGVTPVSIIDDATMSIGSAEIVGLVGESGCGKTMTAMAVLGMLPSGVNITTGSVLFDGEEISHRSARELHSVRGAGIGFISQDPMVSLNPVLKVGWQVAHCVRLHQKVSRREAHRRTIELLRRVQLPDPGVVADKYPHELSGGMAQRVSIARALAGEPRLLIADEPTTALDVTVQAEIMDLLRSLRDERSMAILLVTHDWGLVADLCDRAVVMYAGQIVESAPSGSIFDRPLHPYTMALLRSDPHRASVDARLPTIPGTVPRPGTWPSGCHFQARCDFVTDHCRSGALPLVAPGPDRECRCIRAGELRSTGA